MSDKMILVGLGVLILHLLIILIRFPLRKSSLNEPLLITGAGIRLNPQNRLGWLIYCAILLCLIALLGNWILL